MTILIKRYANRKLYNTQSSRYITLKGISELIESGEEVRVIDNETGEDITNVALSQILVDSEREGRRVPKSLLSDATPDFEHMVQSAVERVFKLLDLPRRTDIDALNENLRRVAEAVERLEGLRRERPGAPAPEPQPPVPPAPGGPAEGEH